MTTNINYSALTATRSFTTKEAVMLLRYFNEGHTPYEGYIDWTNDEDFAIHPDNLIRLYQESEGHQKEVCYRLLTASNWEVLMEEDGTVTDFRPLEYHRTDCSWEVIDSQGESIERGSVFKLTNPKRHEALMKDWLGSYTPRFYL